jgi:hypothetical protein
MFTAINVSNPTAQQLLFLVVVVVGGGGGFDVHFSVYSAQMKFDFSFT